MITQLFQMDCVEWRIMLKAIIIIMSRGGDDCEVCGLRTCGISRNHHKIGIKKNYKFMFSVVYATSAVQFCIHL